MEVMVDESLDRLHRAGWSVGHVRTAVLKEEWPPIRSRLRSVGRPPLAGEARGDGSWPRRHAAPRASRPGPAARTSWNAPGTWQRTAARGCTAGRGRSHAAADARTARWRCAARPAGPAAGSAAHRADD